MGLLFAFFIDLGCLALASLVGTAFLYFIVLVLTRREPDYWRLYPTCFLAYFFVGLVLILANSLGRALQVHLPALGDPATSPVNQPASSALIGACALALCLVLGLPIVTALLRHRHRLSVSRAFRVSLIFLGLQFIFVMCALVLLLYGVSLF